MTLRKLLEKYDNFIFDLYGTLIDIKSDEWADDTWNKFIEYLDANGIIHSQLENFRDDFFSRDRAYREKPTSFDYPEIDIIPVYAELFSEYGNDVVYDKDASPDEGTVNGIDICEISYKFREVSREYMTLFPGLIDFLTYLKTAGKRIYILSNAQASYTKPEICHFELDKIMDDILMSSDYGCMKPDTAFYNELLNRYNMDRSRTIMFGDSYESDYCGAAKAGIDALWLSRKRFAPANKIYVKLMKKCD